MTPRRRCGVVQPPPIECAKLLILCSRGDEASRWLRTWDVVAQGPLVLAGALVAFVVALSRSGLPSNLADLTVFGVDGRALASGLLVLCGICSVGLMFSGIMRWPGYWREPLRAHLLADIGTDQTPSAAGPASHTAYSFDVARGSSRTTHK